MWNDNIKGGNNIMYTFTIVVHIVNVYYCHPLIYLSCEGQNAHLCANFDSKMVFWTFSMGKKNFGPKCLFLPKK